MGKHIYVMTNAGERETSHDKTHSHSVNMKSGKFQVTTNEQTYTHTHERARKIFRQIDRDKR